MDEEAMEKQYNEVAARAVLGYLYDHDMYMLAEQFCIDCPYLGTGSSSFEWTRLPATVLQKPLQQVMKEFIAMQSQLLQLVNLCSTVVPFPPTESAVVLVDHLINLLKSSNMLGMFNEVIGNQPDYNPIQDIQPQPIPPTPPEIVVGGSAASLDIPIEPVGSTAVPASSISPVHGMAVNTPHMGPIEPNPPPTAVQEQQPLAINQTEGVTLCVPPPSTDNQSKPTAILATVTNNTVVLSPQQINQLKKPVSVEGKPAASPTSGAHEHPAPQPTEKGQSALTGTDATQSNATPLDNPIVSGTTSSRSTSSRKRTHIRILDFGTPPIKRGSPSTSYCSSTGRQSPSAVPPSPPARAIPVLKLPASTDASLEEPEKEQQAVATESDVQSKPKKRTPGRPLELGDVNSNNQWPVGSTPVTKQSAETVRRGPSVEYGNSEGDSLKHLFDYSCSNLHDFQLDLFAK
uniref:Uncharacterized protein n=1 Tax=Anopheles epiroticus TaxID=199890 RepID=A0A182P7X8_9DIPT